MYGNTEIYNGCGNVKMTINGRPLTADVRVRIVWLKQEWAVEARFFQATQLQPGGFMNTALANSQDQLVMPIIVTGTFQHPQVAPDMHGNAALAIWAGLGYAVVDRQSGNMRDRK
jgi:hypothetical protein